MPPPVQPPAPLQVFGRVRVRPLQLPEVHSVVVGAKLWVHQNSLLHVFTVQTLPSSQSLAVWQQVLPAVQHVPFVQFAVTHSVAAEQLEPSVFFGKHAFALQ